MLFKRKIPDVVTAVNVKPGTKYHCLIQKVEVVALEAIQLSGGHDVYDGVYRVSVPLEPDSQPFFFVRYAFWEDTGDDFITHDRMLVTDGESYSTVSELSGDDFRRFMIHKEILHSPPKSQLLESLGKAAG